VRTYARAITHPPPHRVRLKDGSDVDIRPIEPSDAEPLEAGLEELGEESQYHRFLSPKRSFSGRELTYLTSVDHHAHEALVAFEPGTDNGLAVARFIKDRSDPCTAEVAVTVADDWQHRGLGSALLQQLAERATDEGVRWFSATVLETNHEVVALLRKVGPVGACPHRLRRGRAPGGASRGRALPTRPEGSAESRRSRRSRAGCGQARR